MKRLLIITALLLPASWLSAQTNGAVKLALVAESPDASAVLDILTAQLSANDKVHLLERNEIEKVYHEQGMSAENRDDIKLGRILGADGLLLLDVKMVMETNPINGLPAPATNLTARLIAVKPGVILTDEKFSVGDFVGWSSGYANHFDSFLPKLEVDPGHAIAISVINLRSSLQSDQEVETEKELKSLTLQRLSQEQQFFVLERERMQQLGQEKELNSDESAFWDGSYLLEGTVDQNGYSADTITINAQLTPPKGGTPLSFEVSGARTNLAEVINQLADKVVALLKVKSTAPEWSAADEASKFFAEAQWALKWKSYDEAEVSADSAWALGKQDLACAMIRVNAYVYDLSANIEILHSLDWTYSCSYDAQGNPASPPPSETEVQSGIHEELSHHPFGAICKETHVDKNITDVQYTFLNQPPAPGNIDRATHALELYYDFSRSSPDGQPKVLYRGEGWNDWHDSDWYELGIGDLDAASRVLQNFNLATGSQNAVADKLQALRSLARRVANLISESPSVHDSYFVGDRPVTHDELSNTLEEAPNIFECQVIWGYLWQERPDDTLALYRELMGSPVFSYIHNYFWLRNLQTPRLTGWNDEDRKNIPVIWNGFERELADSTNAFLRLEVKALQFADAGNGAEMGMAFTNLFDSILENSNAFLTNNVEVLYLDWGTGALIEAMNGGNIVFEKMNPSHSAMVMVEEIPGNGIETQARTRLHDTYYSVYRPKLESLDQEYWQNTVPALQFLPTFQKQKQYLANQTPYDFFKFADLFGSRDYSKSQAREIQPLIVVYKSNLVAQSQSASMMQKGQLMGALAQVGFLEDNVNRILNPPAPIQAKMQPPAIAKVAQSSPVSHLPLITKVTPRPVATNQAVAVTNLTVVNRFSAIPVDTLFNLQSGDTLTYSRVTITAHQELEEKLICDLHYEAAIYNSNSGGRNVDNPAIAVFDPATQDWNVIDCPSVDITGQNNFYYRTTLLHGELFHSDGGKIWKYDKAGRQWNPLSISDGNNYELFTVNDHLYAANGTVIFEITDDGTATHLLASSRRQPPESSLDTLDLGTPTLFEGPGHSLRVCANGKIFTWTGNDWQKNSEDPSSSYPPEIMPGGVLLRTAHGDNPPFFFKLSYLATEAMSPEIYLSQMTPGPPGIIFSGHTQVTPPPDSFWKAPPDLAVEKAAAALRAGNLCLFTDHTKFQEITNDQHEVIGEKIIPRDGYDGKLSYFSRDLPLPQNFYLRFEAPDGERPVNGSVSSPMGFHEMPATWITFSTRYMIFGLEVPRSAMPLPYNNRLGIGNKPGIWLLPVSELEPGIVAQKQIQLTQIAHDQAAAEKSHADFLAKYDLNHNGIIDPEEKEMALDDPAFIGTQLDQIDTNHNGMLDPEELAYFDVTHRKYPTSKEEAGIEITERLLAQRLMKEFDANDDGALDQPEFEKLCDNLQAGTEIQTTLFFQPLFPIYRNPSGVVDIDALTGLLEQLTQNELQHIERRGGLSPGVQFGMMAPGAIQNRHLEQQEFFKTVIAVYWQSPNMLGAGALSHP